MWPRYQQDQIPVPTSGAPPISQGWGQSCLGPPLRGSRDICGPSGLVWDISEDLPLSTVPLREGGDRRSLSTDLHPTWQVPRPSYEPQSRAPGTSWGSSGCTGMVHLGWECLSVTAHRSDGSVPRPGGDCRWSSVICPVRAEQGCRGPPPSESQAPSLLAGLSRPRVKRARGCDARAKEVFFLL